MNDVRHRGDRIRRQDRSPGSDRTMKSTKEKSGRASGSEAEWDPVTKSHAFHVHQFSVRRRTFWQLVVRRSAPRPSVRVCACGVVGVCVCGRRTARTAPPQRRCVSVDLEIPYRLCAALFRAISRPYDRSITPRSIEQETASAIFAISARKAQ